MRTYKTDLIHTRRTVIRLKREHYIRTDIDCRLPGFSSNPFTTPDCAAILTFDADTILHQIDALKHESLNNILILQTVYERIRSKSRSIQGQLERILRMEGKNCYLFANENFLETWVPQTEEMTILEHREELIKKALEFLGERFPVIYLCENPNWNIKGVTCQTIQQFAENHPELSEILTYAESSGGSEAIFEPYTPLLEVQKLLNEKKAFTGYFYVSRVSSDRATVSTPTGEIIVEGKVRQNRAINGDFVAVELLPESEFSKVGDTLYRSGKVIAIVKKADRVICGTVQEPTTISDDWQNVLVVPMDRLLPKIRIRTRQVRELIGFRVQVAIDDWDCASKYPRGHYIATIGASGDIKTESEVILLSHQIPHDDFPISVIECLPPDDYVPSEEEVAKRRDLRNRLVVSIDPPGCKDIDDALHFRQISETEAEIGVHIADVSYFVREGTAIDLEARERGTSVYLTEKRINMLPGLLCDNLCSLVGGVERFAFSVVATMDLRTAETKDIWFGRTIVMNRSALSYQKAQSMVMDDSDHSDITESIRGLLKLSRIMKRKRFEAGALELASLQLHFTLDSETMEPLSGELYEHHDVNSLIEEFMLYANIEVAKRIFDTFPQSALLRRHQSPVVVHFDALNRALKRYDLQINPNSNKLLAKSLDNIKDHHPELDQIVRTLSTRCLQPAKYFAAGTQDFANFQHFGLATPIYTHFTSPIRRYCDLMVHRQLAAAVGLEPVTDIMSSRAKVSEIADALNFRHRMAQQAGRDSAELFMMEMLRKTPDRIEEGRITQIKPTVFVVLLQQFGVEGHVHVDETWSFLESEEILQKGQLVLHVFDVVKVKVNVSPMNMHGRSRLDLELVTSLLD